MPATKSKTGTGALASRVQLQFDLLHQYTHDIGQYPVLTRQEEWDTALEAWNGSEAARDRLVNHNLRFVVMIARSYWESYRADGLQIMDMIADGNVGLLDAATRFDPRRGTRFITYARDYIVSAIRTGIRSCRTPIRCSKWQLANLRRVRAIQDAAQEWLGRELTAEEIADATGMSEESVKCATNYKMRIDSLDAPVSEGRHTQLPELLVAPDAEEDARAEALLEDRVAEAIGCAIEDPRQRIVVMMYFGLGLRRYTLEEIGTAFGFTRECARLLKEKGLRKLHRYFHEVADRQDLFVTRQEMEGRRALREAIHDAQPDVVRLREEKAQREATLSSMLRLTEAFFQTLYVEAEPSPPATRERRSSGRRRRERSAPALVA